MSSETSREYRLHWLSLFIGLLRSARHVVILVLFAVFATKKSSGAEHLIAPLVIIVLSGVVAVAQYVSFRYRYDESELVIRSGIIRRNERHIPYDRIQNIDATANIVERMFGVVTVQLQTGAGGKAEGEFRVLPEAALAEMRRRVFSRGPATAAEVFPSAAIEQVDHYAALALANAGAPLPTGRTLLHLSPSELLLCGFIENRVMAVVLSGVFIVNEMQDKSTSLGQRIAEWTGSTSLGMLTIVGLALATLLVIRLASTVWELVRLYDFRLTRHGDDLRVEYGLLTRVTATIPLRRVQAISIHASLLHRILGRSTMMVSTAGGGVGHAGKHRRELLAPIIGRSAVAALVEELHPGADPDGVAWRPPHPRAFARMMRRWLLVTGILAIAAAPFIHWWALGAEVAVIVLGVIRARLRVSHLGWGLLSDGVIFRYGALQLTTVLSRFARVQAVQFDENPIDRWTGMATVSVDTAGSHASGMRMPFLIRSDAVELRALVAARSGGTEFVW